MEREAVKRKKEEVKRLTEKLEKAISFYIVDYTGLDANAMNSLRGKFKSSNFDYFVIKNSILERASEQLGFEEIKAILAGPNSISISYDDPIGPARIINDHYKETELPTVKLCFIEGKWLSSEEVRRLANLPPREVLVGQVLNVMISPVSRFVGLLSNLLSGLLRVVDGIREQQQEEQGAVQEMEAAAKGEDEKVAQSAAVEQGEEKKAEASGDDSTAEEPAAKGEDEKVAQEAAVEQGEEKKAEASGDGSTADGAAAEPSGDQEEA